MRAASWLRGIVAVLIGLVVAVMTAWAAGAIYYSDLPGGQLRAGLAIGFVVLTVLAFLFLRRRRRTLLGFIVVFALLVAWWLRIPASNQRDWQPEVSVTPWATIDGDRVTIHGVRNRSYCWVRSYCADFQPRTAAHADSAGSSQTKVSGPRSRTMPRCLRMAEEIRLPVRW